MRISIIESEPPEFLAGTRQSHARNYGEVLQGIHAGIEIVIAAPYERSVDEIALSSVDAVVFPGAGVAWSADAIEARPLRDTMEAVFARGLPCFGSCMGLQLAGVILGGRVESRKPELGVAKAIELTDAGLAHPMMQGRQPIFTAPTVHGDQVVEMPGGARLLAANAHCQIQAFTYQCSGVDFWGVEYHPEIAIADIGRYIRANAEKFADAQHLVDDLLVAETDALAAARLGTSTDDMNTLTRTTELRNWINYLEAL